MIVTTDVIWIIQRKEDVISEENTDIFQRIFEELFNEKNLYGAAI